VAILSALISVNGAVAALLPVVVVLAVRLGRSPGRLLMPLVFGAHCGSMLLLTGTPVNVLISDALQDVEGRNFGYFEFAMAGIPLVIGGIVISRSSSARSFCPRGPARRCPRTSAGTPTRSSSSIS
jgi:di/tricarboxylate transporter